MCVVQLAADRWFAKHAGCSRVLIPGTPGCFPQACITLSPLRYPIGQELSPYSHAGVPECSSRKLCPTWHREQG